MWDSKIDYPINSVLKFNLDVNTVFIVFISSLRCPVRILSESADSQPESLCYRRNGILK